MDITPIGRELPYSMEAEQSVIGSVLKSSQSVALSAEIVKPDDFYFESNREIYRIVMELFNENTPIDIVTVSDRLNQADKLEAVGGITYLTSVATAVPTTRNIGYYSKIVKEKSVLRRLIKATHAISEMAYSESDKTERILEQAEQLIFDVSAGRNQSDIVPISDVLMGSYTEMVENSLNKGKLTGLPTGFHELDRRMAGLQNSDLILIAGRPGMGKSSFAVNIAEHVAIEENVTVAIFNLEMSKSQLVNRILCSQALVDSNKMRLGELSGSDWQQIGEVVDKVAMAPLYIDDTPSITVSEIRAKCRRLKQTKNLGLVVIDYLQLMQSSGRADNRQQEISEISRSLKILAKELDIPVITLSQLSRASESRSDKRPMLSDLRESGAIEQDADIVIFLYRDEYYNKDSEDKNLAECIIAKYRSGETGMFKLGWQGKYTKFLNIEIGATEYNG
ncbi:MAG: replicative DNA helicase [Clostridia bacterium]|nr:replicative DNA helicase [Clostridia bacterium]